MKFNALLLDSRDTQLTYPVLGQIEILGTGTDGRITNAVVRPVNDDETYSAPVEVKDPSFLVMPEVNRDQLQNSTSDTVIEFFGKDLRLPMNTMIHYFPHPEDVLGQADFNGPNVSVWVNDSGHVQIDWAGVGGQFAFVPLKRGSVEMRYLPPAPAPSDKEDHV